MYNLGSDWTGCQTRWLASGLWTRKYSSEPQVTYDHSSTNYQQNYHSKLSPCWMISGNTMIIIDKSFTESSFPWLRNLQGTLRCLFSCSPWAQYSLCIFENYHRIITEYGTTRVRNCCLWKPWCSCRPKVIILWILLLPEVFSRVLPVFVQNLQFHENYHRKSVWSRDQKSKFLKKLQQNDQKSMNALWNTKHYHLTPLELWDLASGVIFFFEAQKKNIHRRTRVRPLRL